MSIQEMRVAECGKVCFAASTSQKKPEGCEELARCCTHLLNEQGIDLLALG